MPAKRHRELEVAWAAGLFEGEGSFALEAKGRYGLTYARASLGMTDEDTVRHFHKVVGVGVVTIWDSPPPRQRQWRWRTSSRADFATVADLLAPWLHERRAARLAEIRAATSPDRRKRRPVTKCRRGHPLTGDNRKPNGRTKDGEQRITCRTCANARERGELT